MTGKLLFLILSSRLLHTVSSKFVLKVSPVPFVDIRSPDGGDDALTLFLEATTPTLSDRLNLTDGCELERGPFGEIGTLDTAKEEEWEIHVSTRDAHYLKMNREEVVTNIDLSIRFGDDPSCKPSVSAEPTLMESPIGYSVVGSTIEMSSCYLAISINLELNKTGCNILGHGDHDLVFAIDKTFGPSNFQFLPCQSFLRLEVDSVEYKSDDDAPGNQPGRSLEEETCIYCQPGEECACCPDLTSKKLAFQNPASQKPSVVAVVGVTLGAIATALGIGNILLFYSSRASNPESGAEGGIASSPEGGGGVEVGTASSPEGGVEGGADFREEL